MRGPCTVLYSAPRKLRDMMYPDSLTSAKKYKTMQINSRCCGDRSLGDALVSPLGTFSWDGISIRTVKFRYFLILISQNFTVLV